MSDLDSLSRSSRGKGLAAASEAPSSAVPAPPRRLLLRIVLPGLIALAVLALLGYAMRDAILPAQKVSVVRAVALPANGSSASQSESPSTVQSGGTVVAQAPGWIEPDPYPVYVTALADGVVEKVHVLEGDTVTAGQLLVELVNEDAALSLKQVKADLDKAQAAYSAALQDYEQPITLSRNVAVAKARLAESKASLIRLDAEVAKEQAHLAELNAAYLRLARVNSNAVSKLEVEAAKYKVESHEAILQATRQKRPVIEAQVEAANAELDAAELDLSLKTVLKKTRDEAAAALQSAKVRVEQAELRLKRMRLFSPTDGVVMARLVAPGAKLMLGGDGEHSAHAIHIYKPKEMQVRVDVPLADAALVGVGQRAVVVVDVLPDRTFTGVVTRVVNRADIAKNTVQFKVALDQPSELLKPEMLARVKFFGAGGGDQSAETSSVSSRSTAVAIQESAVRKQGDEAFVWWVSPNDSRIDRRVVDLGAARGDGLIEVRSGLNPADVIVDSPSAELKQGQRVRYNAELAE